MVPRLTIFFALLLLVSCVDRTDSVSASVESDSRPGRPLTIFTWEDYISKSVLDKFSKETGIEAQLVPFSLTLEVMQKLQSMPGQFDVVIVDDVILRDELVPLKLIQPLDRSLLGNFGNYDPGVLNLSYDPENTFSVPYMSGKLVIGYRKDKIPEPAASWGSLFNPEYRGKVGMYRERIDCFTIGFSMIDRIVQDLTLDDLQKASDILLKHAETQEIQFADDVELRDKLLAGEILISTLYECDALMEQREHPDKIGVVNPPSAQYWYMDTVSVPVDTDRYEEAHKFIDFIARDEIAAELAEYWFSRSANPGAFQFLSEEIQEYYEKNPRPENFSEFVTPPIIGEQRNLVNKTMSELLRPR